VCACVVMTCKYALILLVEKTEKSAERAVKHLRSNGFSKVTMAISFAAGRERHKETAVTKHQQRSIKNFLRFPIKRDYRNKFESLVATPYPIL
jgi:hypothetical protein